MEIDKEKIVTQEETGETAPIDTAGQKAKEEMKELAADAKKTVEEGVELGDEDES